MNVMTVVYTLIALHGILIIVVACTPNDRH